MTKYYCDSCKKEITKKNACQGGPISCDDRLGIELVNGLKIEIMTGHEGTWNAGHFCKYCVIDAVYQLDDRNKKNK